MTKLKSKNLKQGLVQQHQNPSQVKALNRYSFRQDLIVSAISINMQNVQEINVLICVLRTVWLDCLFDF
jgi:hypothetical protein